MCSVQDAHEPAVQIRTATCNPTTAGASEQQHVRTTAKAERASYSDLLVERDQLRTTEAGSSRPVQPFTAGTARTSGASTGARWETDQQRPTSIKDSLKISSSQEHEQFERQQPLQGDGREAAAEPTAAQARRRGMSDSQRSAGRNGTDGNSREGAAKDSSRSGDRHRSASQQQEQRPSSPPRGRSGDRRRPPSPGRHHPLSPRQREQQQQQQRRPNRDDRQQQQRRGPPSPRGPPPPPPSGPLHPRDRDRDRDTLRDCRFGSYRDGPPPWDSQDRDRDRGPGPYHQRQPPLDEREPHRDLRDRERDRDRLSGGYRGPVPGGGRPYADDVRGGGVPVPPAPPRMTPRDRSRSRERVGRQLQQQQLRPRGGTAAAAGGGAVEIGNAFALLERFLSKHEALRETIAPTAANVNTVYLSRADTVMFIGVQQWLASHLGMELQLLAGTYVLVPAHDIPLLGDGGDAERATIPLRVRQVATVELPPDAQQPPESVLVLLEGGGEVMADRLSEQQLTDLMGHQELCCELASLQCEQMMPLLTLHQLAHTVWRLQLCADLEGMTKSFAAEQQSLQELGLDADTQRNAAANSYNMMRARIQQLPKPAFTQEVLAYVEQQPGGPEGLKQQLEAMDVHWQQYRQDMMAGRTPQLLQQQQQGSLDVPALVPVAAAPAPVEDSIDSLQKQQPALQVQHQQMFGQQQQHLGPGGPVHPVNGPLGFSDDVGLGLGLGFDEDNMFDDPTGLGGLSPIPAAAGGGTAAPVVQKQGSLGFGMAAGGWGAGAGGGLGGARVQKGPGAGGFQLPTQQQQQQQQQQLLNSGPLSGGLNSARGLGSGAAAAAAAAAAAPSMMQHHPDLQAFMTKYNSSSERGNGRSVSGVPDAAAAAAAPTTDYSYWVQQGDRSAAQADPRTRRAAGLMMQTTASVAAAGGPQAPGSFNQGPGFGQGMVPPGGQTLNPAGGSGGLVWEGQAPGSFALPPGLGNKGLNSQQQQQQQQQLGSSAAGARVSVLDRLGVANEDDEMQEQQQQQGRQQEDERPHRSTRESPPSSRAGGGSKRARSPEGPGRKQDSSRDKDRPTDKEKGLKQRRGSSPEPPADNQRDSKRKEKEKQKERERDSRRDRKPMSPAKRQQRSRSSSRSRARSPAPAPGSSSRRASSTDNRGRRQADADLPRVGGSSSSKDHRPGRERSRDRARVSSLSAAAAAPQAREPHREKPASGGGGSGSSRDKDRPPPPEVAEILQRLLPRVPASAAAGLARTASADRDRARATDRAGEGPRSSSGRLRSRSRSVERRSSKRSRTSPSPPRGERQQQQPQRDERRGPEAESPRGGRAAAAGGLSQRASPAAAARVDVEVARRRFAGRLEGADELFGQLSAEAVTREWLHRLDDVLRRERVRSVKLGFLSHNLPIPPEVFSHWGGIFGFLAQHPALTWQPTAKLVGLREGIDLDALPMLPPSHEHREQQQQQQQQQQHWSNPGRPDGSGGGSGFGDDGGSRFRLRDEGAAPRWKSDSALSPGQQQQQQRGRFEGGPDGIYGDGRGSRESRSPGRPGPAAAGIGRPAHAASAVPALQLSPEDQAGRQLYEQVLAFATSLQRQLADAPEQCMELADAYALLPLQLRSKVAPGTPIDMQKFLEDNIGGVEVVRRDGRLLVVALPAGVSRERVPPRTCAYWDIGGWTGCFKEARCNFRHALGPSDQRLNMWM